MIWNTEEIPDIDSQYLRIHKNNIRDGDVIPGAFRERGEGEDRGMSTDWSKYSTPIETRNRARIPKDNGVLHFLTGDLRHFNLNVFHRPIQNNPYIEDNRAHTNVKGLTTEVRLKLLSIFVCDIPPPVLTNFTC